MPGDQCLGTDPVGAGDQDRLAIPIGVQGEQPSEAAQTAEDLGAEGGRHQWSDRFDGPLPGIDVDPGPGVGGRGGGAGSGEVGVGWDPAHARVPPAAPLRAGLAPIWTGTGTG